MVVISMNNFIILLMWLLCYITTIGSMDVVRHTRAAMPWKLWDNMKIDNKRYASVKSRFKNFDKIFLYKMQETIRERRSLTTASNQAIDLSKHQINDTNLTMYLNEIKNSSAVNVLNLSENYLTQINKNMLDHLPYLSDLDVSQNKLKLVDDAIELTKLTTLNVSHNNLYKFATTISDTTADAANIITKLQILDLSCNKFNASRNIVLYNLNYLHTLDISCNYLTEIDRNLFFNLSRLSNLDVSYNRLNQIEKDTFAYVTELELLNLSNNNISFIQNDTFIMLPKLQFLDVSSNCIQVHSIRALQGIPDLIGLSIAFNTELSESLQGFVATWSLKELDVSGTGLCQIPTALTQSVRILKLANNFLESIHSGDLDSYPLLQHLTLSSNYLKEIEDDALGRLEIIETLYLNDNQLKRIPISLPASLIELHLEKNQITEIQPQVLIGLKNLELLNLADNNILYLPGLPLPKLAHLNMKNCELESVNQDIVKMSPYLKEIFLDGNPVRCAELLGVAEWATPCRDIEIERDAVINEDGIIDYLEKLRHYHSCEEKWIKTRKNTTKSNKVCKKVITTNRLLLRNVTAKINDNNYLTDNDEHSKESSSSSSSIKVLTDNKLIERQSSLGITVNSSNETMTRKMMDKNMNEKFKNTDVIVKQINTNITTNTSESSVVVDVPREDGTFEQMMIIKNNTIIINETKLAETTQRRTNITSSFNKLSHKINTKKISNKDDGQQRIILNVEQKKMKKEEFSKLNSAVRDNQFDVKKYKIDTLVGKSQKMMEQIISTKGTQSNDVNQSIKLSKGKKMLEKQITNKNPPIFEHVINMSNNKTTNTKGMLTNDDDYMNDDKAVVVDNAVVTNANTFNMKKVEQKEEKHATNNGSELDDNQKEKLLQTKSSTNSKPHSLQLTNFNFTKHHPDVNTDNMNNISKKIITTMLTTTAKPYQTKTLQPTKLTIHSSINTNKHVQLNTKLNVNPVSKGNQDKTVYNNNNNKETTTKPQQSFLQQTKFSEIPPQLVSANDDEVPTQQEWSDTRSAQNQSLGHPGLFMVIGATIGIVFAFGIIQLYRCHRVTMWRRPTNSIHEMDVSTINTPTRHDLLPMEILNHSVPNSPIELW